MKKINWKGVELTVYGEDNRETNKSTVGQSEGLVMKSVDFNGPIVKYRDLEDYYLDDADESEAAGLLDCEDTKMVTRYEGKKRRPRSWHRRVRRENEEYLSMVAMGVKPSTVTFMEISKEPDVESIISGRKVDRNPEPIDIGEPGPVFELNYSLLLNKNT